MSLFFEDVEIKNKKQDTTSVFVEDVTGLIALTLESEMAWHNLETSMMKEEFKHVIKENEKGLENSKESLFKRMVALFNKLWEGFVQAVKQLTTRLQVQFVNGAKFLKARDEKLKKFTDADGKEVEIYQWKVQTVEQIKQSFPLSLGQTLAKMISEAGSQKKAFTVDEIVGRIVDGAKSLSDMDRIIIEKARNSKRIKIKVNRKLAMMASSDLQGAKGVLNHIKGLAKEAQKLVNEGKKEALEGLKAVKDNKEEVQKQKVATTSTARACITAINKVLNLFVKLVLEKYADSMKVIRSATATSAEKDKAEKKEQKGKNPLSLPAPSAEQKEKNESLNLFGLTLEDFEEDEDDELLDEELELSLEDFNLGQSEEYEL
jgi:hypothetical protein